MKQVRVAAVVAILGMITVPSWAIDTKFIWVGDCDCYCWLNSDCWTWIGDPLRPYPWYCASDNVLISGTSPVTILIDDGCFGSFCKELAMETRVTFGDTSGSTSDEIKATAIELRAMSSAITITVSDSQIVGTIDQCNDPCAPI
ncbi:MAG: hypothetical protein AB7N71_12455 [Phycisphaerae bacterium]